jgi:hypothetical protein
MYLESLRPCDSHRFVTSSVQSCPSFVSDTTKDDSLSMITEEGGKRIKALETTLSLVARVYELAREDGIVAIDFLNELNGEGNIIESDIPDILEEHTYTGWTRIGTELEKKVLGELVHDGMVKPLLVLTITDGDVRAVPLYWF